MRVTIKRATLSRWAYHHNKRLPQLEEVTSVELNESTIEQLKQWGDNIDDALNALWDHQGWD